MFMDYTALSTDDLADRYIALPDERLLIKEYVSTLNDYQKGYFNHLTQPQEQLPLENFAGNNTSIKRDNTFIWSDLFSIDSLIWHFHQEWDDTLNLGQSPNLPRFIDRQLYKANEKRIELVNSYNRAEGVIELDQYSQHIHVYEQYINFLEKKKAGAVSTDKVLESNVSQPLPEIVAPTILGYANPTLAPNAGQLPMTEREKEAIKHIKYMSGLNMQGAQIMTSEEYQRLYNYTLHLVHNEEIPNDIKPIYNVRMPSGHIRYTYYLVHVHLYGKKPRREYFIGFLYRIFPGIFDEDHVSWNTTSIKFSTQPPSWSSDLDIMNGKIGK